MDQLALMVNAKQMYPNIFAIGDVAGPPWLAHKSSAQGHMVADFINGKIIHEIDHLNIPSCTYCQPQVGSLGLTESRALELGHSIKVGKFFFELAVKLWPLETLLVLLN